MKLKKKKTSKFTRVNVQFPIAQHFKKGCYMQHVGARVLIHLDIILKYVVVEGFLKLCLAQLSILQMFDIMDIYELLPYYLGSFNINYITSGYPRPSVTVRHPCIVLLNSPYFIFLKMLYAPKKKKTPGINQCGEKGSGGVLHTHRFCVFEKFRTIGSEYN